MTRIAIGVSGILMTWSLIGAGADAPATRLSANSDMVCGPRCARFILKRYGQEVDLVELVKEIQWPDLEAGASLDQIARCLQARGIHTKVVKFSPGRRLNWTHPAILYTDEGTPARGHYVVSIPAEEAETDDLVWAGVEGWRRGRWEEITRGFSGVALLTSPDPIPDAALAVEHLRAYKLLQIAGLASAGAILAHLLIRALARWISRSRLGASVSSR